MRRVISLYLMEKAITMTIWSRQKKEKKKATKEKSRVLAISKGEANNGGKTI